MTGPAHLPPRSSSSSASRQRRRRTRALGVLHLLLRAGSVPASPAACLETPRCPPRLSLALSRPPPLPWPSSHRPSTTVTAPRCPRGHRPPLASLAVQPLRQDAAGLSTEASDLGTRCFVAIVFVFNVGHQRKPPSICHLPVVPEHAKHPYSLYVSSYAISLLPRRRSRPVAVDSTLTEPRRRRAHRRRCSGDHLAWACVHHTHRTT